MRESFFLRIATDEPARMWGGVGDIEIPADAVETETAIYLGGGELLSAPDFQQLINGIAERIEIKVSGVSAVVVALALDEAQSIEGRAVHFGTAQFDDHWQMISSISWLAEFRADTITVSEDPGNGNRIRSVSISIGSDSTGRSRAPISRWTDADQRRRSSTDRFFDHIAMINSGTSRRFGPSDS